MPFNFLNLRPAPPVPEQPRVQMRDWRFVLVGDNVLLVGMVDSIADALTWRITSPVCSIDASMRTARTSSGRCYELVGAPALQDPALAVTDVRLALAGHADVVDLTQAIWEEMLRYVH